MFVPKYAQKLKVQKVLGFIKTYIIRIFAYPFVFILFIKIAYRFQNNLMF